jgi:hypothetical protein
MTKTEVKVHEAVADAVAAHLMRGEHIHAGESLTIDHCFGDESTDAKHPDQSWTRFTATVDQSHLERAAELVRIYR